MVDAYANAGVNIDAGMTFADMIKDRIKQVWPEGAKEIGGFAGTGLIPEGAKKIAGSTDGTGTVAILSALINYFPSIGYNAVAMGAVDTFVQGYRPAYLLDSLDVARLNPAKHIQIIDSIIEACKLAGCQLIGGETAELPDMFKYDWMYNLNVAVIGFPDPRLKLIPVEAGHEIYGWLSYGPGSNGFSLLRKVHSLKIIEGFNSWLRKIFQMPGSIYDVKRRLKQGHSDYLGDISLGGALLTPTPIYIKNVYKQIELGVQFSGHAHITGGGLVDNIPRSLPENLKAVIWRNSWRRPGIFRLTQELGGIGSDEMDRVFNNGIIMTSFVPEGTIIEDPHAVWIGKIKEREDMKKSQIDLHGEYLDS